LNLNLCSISRALSEEAFQHSIFAEVVREARAAAHTGAEIRYFENRLREPSIRSKPLPEQGVSHRAYGGVEQREPRLRATFRRRNPNDTAGRGADPGPSGDR